MSEISAEEQVMALGHAVITTDPDGVILAWNPAAERLYGWPEADVIGRNVADVIVPDISRGTGEDIMRALRAGVPWSGGFPVHRKDGTVFTALVTDTGLYREGKLVGIVGVSTNLGVALRPLAERSADAALMLGADTTVLSVSPAVQHLFGWSEEQLIGYSLLTHVHPDDRQVLAVVLARVATEPGPRPPHEVRVRRGNRWAWAEAAFTNFLDDPLVRAIVCNLRHSLAHDLEESAEERADRVESSLRSRLVLEQAKGFLAGRHDIGVHEALTRILEHAADHQLSPTDVAEAVVSGELDLDVGA